ncbi:MAG: tryptophan-rich sensory protein [Oscillospiraceae bacterium]|nr:tryptophan-rich sensory protein [Oscillospiraceae bacterium]
MKKHNISDMLIYIISAEVIGAVSALLAGGFSDFFNKYEEPPLLPPGWLFPVVWTILYAVMGYSAYLVTHSYGETAQKKTALTIYWTQLALNFMWSIIFFRFEALWLAFVVIMALWVMIIAMILSFRKISPLAAYINIPYLLWVTFAAYLNLATAIIN